MDSNFHNHSFPSLFNDFLLPVFISEWKDKLFYEKKITVKVLRLDAQHRHIGGNKLYKLYYNLLEAKSQDKNKLLTFGGAYSNHLRATAFAAKELGVESIGIIRGEESQNLNPVLEFCENQGMQLHYFSRTKYREKNKIEFIEKLQRQFGNFYMIPEGGSNALALKGTKHIPEIALNLINKNIDYFVLAIGTGGTTAGILSGINEILNSQNNNQKNLKSKVLAISSLKGGDFLLNDIAKLLNDFYGDEEEKIKSVLKNLILETNFHEGGYAKKSKRLIDFISKFNKENNFQIEPIYTGKAFLAVYELVKQNFFVRGDTIVLIHTGGIF